MPSGLASVLAAGRDSATSTRALYLALTESPVNRSARRFVDDSSDAAYASSDLLNNNGTMIMMKRTLMAAALSLACAGAFAQTTAASTTQRDVNQQTRIENGLKDGSLSTKEASTLEKQQSRVDRLQAKDLKNGSLSAGERAQLNAAQNKVSSNIAADKHNAVTGNPNSASSQRMQADVARNVNQDKRIEGGIQNGSLTNHEVSKLDAGQAHVDRKEARAGANGHVGKAEQASIQHSENRQTRRIHRQKTDAQVRG
jgi:hypothetical protein